MPDGGLAEIKGLLDQQGQAFEAFKQTHEQEMKAADAATQEKLSKIEASLDAAVEAKAAIDVKLEAERKEREDLEARINRMRLETGKDAGKADVELKDFNGIARAAAVARNRPFQELDAEQYGAYKSGFWKWMREGEKALGEAEHKAMSVGSDPDGGYFVTPDLTGRIVRKIFETTPMRQIASVQRISSDKLEGIEDLNEAGAGYAGETSQGSDTTTPQIGSWSIPVYWIDTEPKMTQQLLDDAEVNVEAWLGDKVGKKLGRFENAEFVNGATGKIRGLTSYATVADSGSGVTWGSFGHVATGAAGALASSNPLDVFITLTGVLKDEYLANAGWLMRRGVVATVRKIKDGNGNYVWQPSFAAGTPETILGYPLTRAEDMPAIAANSLSIGFGDFAEAYQIVDRIGIRILRDPYTNKPYVKFYTTKRTGGGAVNFEAVKFLKFAAS